MNTFERLESQVRSYSRTFPAEFAKATGACLYDADDRRFIDFFAGAGSLNYGHNHPAMKRAVIDYLTQDGVVHSLDMATTAKRAFMEQFERVILQPRALDYKLQFTGPTGTNAVEAALKLARRVKQRSNVVAFTNSYHGVTSGALSVTAGSFFRHESYVNRLNVSFLPYDGFLGHGINTMEFIEKSIAEGGSGVDLPAAVIVETLQAEGGVNVASQRWLQQLQAVCREWDILLIVDDIQVGCGRTGSFFSFERAGIQPDMVLLSKSISGLGLPMSLLLLRPEVDQWRPGEHSGTFRGNNLAFVTATEALRNWETNDFAEGIAERSTRLAHALAAMQQRYPELNADVRGRGLIYGLAVDPPHLARAISREAFQQGLIVELCGPRDEVLKLLPPLNIDLPVLEEGLDVLARSIEIVLASHLPAVQPTSSADVSTVHTFHTN